MIETDYFQKIRNTREALRNHHRMQDKNRLFSEMRRNIITAFQQKSNNFIIPNQLITTDYVQELLSQNPPHLLMISKILSSTNINLDMILKYHTKAIIQICFQNLDKTESIVIIGNICDTAYFDKFFINNQMINLIQDVINDNIMTPQKLNLILWMLNNLYEKTKLIQIIKIFDENFINIFNKVNFSNDFIEMVANYNSVKPLNEQWIENIYYNKWQESQSQKILILILQIIENHLLSGKASQEFIRGIIEKIQRCLNNKFKKSIKSLAIQNIGIIASVYGEEILEYITKNKIIDQLLYRSKIDTHNIKLSAINVICTVIIFSNNIQIDILINKGVAQILVRCLQYQSTETLLQVLKAIGKILLVQNKNRHRIILMNYGIEKFLFKLQTHKNPAIYQLTESIITQFFKDLFE